MTCAQHKYRAFQQWLLDDAHGAHQNSKVMRHFAAIFGSQNSSRLLWPSPTKDRAMCMPSSMDQAGLCDKTP